MACGAPLPNETIITKTTNSAFVGTPLEKMIRERGIKRLVFCGLTTCHCVSTSVRMANNLRVVEHSYGTPVLDGLEESRGRIVIISDAVAMWGIKYGVEGKKLDGETAHQVHLAALKDEFCDVERTAEVVQKLRSGQES